MSSSTSSSKPPGQALPCVLACSGCSHAGELADHTARRLNELGMAKMSCLAGIGGHVKSITTTVQRAPELLMIDGCPLECGANSLRLVGITEFQHLKLHEHGVRKHESPVDTPTVERLTGVASSMLVEKQTDSEQGKDCESDGSSNGQFQQNYFEQHRDVLVANES